MRKFIFKTAAVSAIAILAIGCQQKELDTDITENVAGNLISAVIPEELGTRVSMGAPEDGVGLELAWEAEDKLTVIGETTETFSIKEGFEAHKADFEGNAVNGSSYTILYPGTYTSVDAINAVSFVNQTQIGNAATDHLEWTAMVSDVENYASLNFADGKANGVIKFHLLLPEGVNSVASITIGADDAVFHTTNKGDELVKELTLNVADLTIPEDRIITAYMMTSWNNIALEAGKTLYITITDADGLKNIKALTVPETGLTIKAGKVNVLNLNGESWTEPYFFGGSGTEEDPFLIKTFFHLSNVKRPLSSGMENKVWFKMVADVDMKGQEWTMIAPSTDLVYLYDFNGNDHTIKNFTYEGKSGASFFGAITGGSKVHDLKFDTVVLSDEVEGSSSVGVVSYNVIDGVIDNVDVKNVTITSATSNSNNTGTGTIACRIQEGSISNCDVEDIVISTTAERVAGIVGVNTSTGNTIEYCTVKNATITGKTYVGGILGRSSSDDAVKVTGCKLLGTNTITCTGVSTGGIVGEAGGASNISGCEVSGTTSVTGTENTGGIVGLANSKATISKCSVSGATITNTGDRTGGVAGFFNAANSSIDDCHLSSSTLNGTTRTGGMLGQVSNASTTSPTTISKCTATNVTLYGKGSTTDKKDGGENIDGVWIGGILGRNHSSTGVTIHDCTTDVTISTDMTAEQSYLGGIVGETGGTLTMYNCASKATITGFKRLGGLVGAAGNAGSNIYQCAYLGGKISGTSIMGGIVGYANNNIIIADCYSVEAEISGTGGYLGGILGYTLSTSANDISNCYSTMAIATSGSKQNGVGGVVGCFGKSSEGDRKTQNSGTVAKCIAWNTEIGSNNGGTNGCVVGAAGWLSTLSDCWRNPAMTTAFSENPGDHENSSSSSPLTASPYNGKVATDDATVSSIAQTLGWSSTTWDFTYALPALKNLK